MPFSTTAQYDRLSPEFTQAGANPDSNPVSLTRHARPSDDSGDAAAPVRSPVAILDTLRPEFIGNPFAQFFPLLAAVRAVNASLLRPPPPENLLDDVLYSAQPGQPIVISRLGLADAHDDGSPLTVSLSVGQGSLDLIASDSTGVAVEGDNSAALTLTGSLAALDSLLAGAELHYTRDPAASAARADQLEIVSTNAGGGQDRDSIALAQRQLEVDSDSRDGANGFVMLGGREDGFFGNRLFALGDLDADGFADFRINDGLHFGAPSQPAEQGESDVQLPASRFTTLALGDVNGDGFVDWLAEDHLLLGDADTPAQVASGDFDLRGARPLADDAEVVGLGDINGDGFDDLAVNFEFVLSGPGYSSTARRVVVLFGSRDALPDELTPAQVNAGNSLLIQETARGHFVGQLAAAGDINGDGFDDLWNHDRVIFGAADLAPRTETVTAFRARPGLAVDLGISQPSALTTRQSAAGDVNGDGFDDLLLMRAPASPGQGPQVAGYLVYGGQNLPASVDVASLDGRDGLTLTADGPRRGTPSRPLGPGDVNGDGYADLLLSAFTAEVDGQALAGFALLVHGDDFNGALARQQGGAGADNLLGTAGAEALVGGLGDDVLDGGAGSDVLLGGAGDDRLVLDLADRRVDGGGGTDTLTLAGRSDFLLDLHELNGFATRSPANPLRDIEVIDLADSGNALRLSAADVPALVRGDGLIGTLLRVDGGSSDQVSTVGDSPWIDGGLADAAGVPTVGGAYRLLQQGDIRLVIDADIDTSGIGRVGSNLAPVLELHESLLRTRIGSSTPIPGIRLDDVDAGAAEVELRLEVQQGRLLLAEDVAGGVPAAGISGAGTGALRLVGSVTEINASLNGLAYVRNDLNGSATAGTDSLLIRADDRGNSGGPALQAEATLALETVLLPVGAADDSRHGQLTLAAAEVGSGPALIPVGDFNGNGQPDLLRSNFLPDTVVGRLLLDPVLAAGSRPLDALAGGSLSDGDRTVLTAAGDVNGDGFDDLLASDYRRGSSTLTSSVHVLFGGPEPLGDLSQDDLTREQSLVLPGLRLQTGRGDSHEGSALFALGDVNGDGFDDFGVEARIHFPFAEDFATDSQAVVVFGSARGVGIGPALHSLDGNNGFVLDTRARPAGDVNGDGLADVSLGNGVLFGQRQHAAEAAPLDGQNGFAVSGVVNLTAAGDINGDGFADLVSVSTPSFEAPALQVIFGGADLGADLPLSTLDGQNGFALSGLAISGNFRAVDVRTAGDVNADGLDDLLIVDHLDDQIYLVYGDTAPPAELALDQLDGQNGFLIDLAGPGEPAFGQPGALGDIDGDGFDDLLLNLTTPDDFAAAVEPVAQIVFGADRRGEIPVALRGDAGDETLIGSSAGDRLLGGAGDDLLSGGDGNDILIGGAGEDRLLFGRSDTRRVDGGAGRDTLELSGQSGIELDLEAASGLTGTRYRSLEVIDLGGGGNRLLLDSLGVQRVSDDGSNLLRVDGRGSNQVVSQGGEVWNLLGAADADGNLASGGGWQLYASGVARLLVQNAVDADGINTGAAAKALPGLDDLLLGEDALVLATDTSVPVAGAAFAAPLADLEAASSAAVWL